MSRKVNCFVLNCPESSESVGAKFYRFPKPGKTNIERCKKWAKFCQPYTNWTDVNGLKKLYSAHKQICGNHFKADAFSESDPSKLTVFSIPSLSPPEPGNSCSSINLRPPHRTSTPNPGPASIPSFVSHGASFPPPSPVSSASPAKSLSIRCVSSISPLTTPSSTFVTSATPCTVPHSPDLISLPSEFPALPSITSSTFKTPHPVVSASPLPSSPSLITNDAHLSGPQTTLVHTHTSAKCGGKRKRSAPCSLLSQLNVTRFKHLTPRKQMLVRSHRKKDKEVARIKREYSALKEQTSSPNVMDLPVFKRLPPALRLILESTIRVATSKPKGRRRTLDDELQALTLFKNSPKSYYLLRKLFLLPAPRTLRLLLSNFSYGTGVNHNVLESINKSLDKFDVKDRLVSLIFDKMSLRKSLSYNFVTDRIDGFEDHAGQGRNREVATHALVLMVQGLRRKFKQPIAYYLSGSGTSSTRLVVFLTDVIRACEEANIKVRLTVCDMGSNNVKAVKDLGASSDKPYFEIDGHKIYTIFDPCHLLKYTRNNFKEKNVSIKISIRGKFYKGLAKWKHITDVVNQDRRRIFQSLRHIKDAHLNPMGSTRMKVNLAAQIFSQTVASAIGNQHEDGILKGDESALLTAAFCKTMDDMFDSLNGRSSIPYKGKVLRTRITDTSPHHAFYRKAERFVKTWHFAGHSENNPPPSQVGWLTTLRAMQLLWKDLKKAGYNYLEPKSCNQDALQNHFDGVRENCGQNPNPTTPQFVGGFKTSIVGNCAAVNSKGNCEMDNVALLDDLRSLLIEKKKDVQMENDVASLMKDIDAVLGQTLAKSARLKAAIKSGNNESRPISHIAGFVANQLKKKINCIRCFKILLAPKIARYSLISAKAYSDTKRRLKYCADKFVEIIRSSLYASDDQIQKFAHINKLKATISAKLSQKLDFSWLHLNCCNKDHTQKLISELINCVFFITVKWWCQRQNRAFAVEYLRKQQERKIK